MARRKINGVWYSTSKSALVVAAQQGHPGGLWYDRQELHIMPDGHYYLYCTGGACSQWRVVYNGGQSQRGAGWIVPVSTCVAASWAAYHGFSVNGLRGTTPAAWLSFSRALEWDTGKTALDRIKREG